MPRALWKGAISFGLVLVPVELHTAVRQNEFSFSLIDQRNFAPVGYQRINKQTGQPVAWENIVKGYEYEPGEYVVLGDEDFRRANVEATQTVEIVNFVDARELSLLSYDTPYYVVPTKRGEKGYALLREALRRSKKFGVARVVIRVRQHLAALYPQGDLLVLSTLRYADEIKSAADFHVPPNLDAVGIKEKELTMALQLIDSMSEPWRPEEYRDTYREDLMAWIEKKIQAGETTTITEAPEEPKRPAGAQVIDLMAQLKRSLEGKQPKRSPRPTGRATPRATAAGRETAKRRSTGSRTRH